jgi:apolipoprotein D and lipocalin family protein
VVSVFAIHYSSDELDSSAIGGKMRVAIVVFMSLFVGGCLGVPKGVSPVKDFDSNKYLGKWYEIARLDHSFERGLNSISAEYSLRDDGGVRVINRGFSIAGNKWKETEGKAYFVNGQDQGHLKVSFFGPFYSSYVVFELDKDKYQYAFVAGYNKSYLWLLSRTPTVNKDLIDQFVFRGKDLGFDTDKLIFVEQNLTH